MVEPDWKFPSVTVCQSAVCRTNLSAALAPLLSSSPSNLCLNSFPSPGNIVLLVDFHSRLLFGSGQAHFRSARLGLTSCLCLGLRLVWSLSSLVHFLSSANQLHACPGVLSPPYKVLFPRRLRPDYRIWIILRVRLRLSLGCDYSSQLYSGLAPFILLH